MANKRAMTSPPKHTCDAVKGSFGCHVCDEMDPRTRTPPKLTPKDVKENAANAAAAAKRAVAEKINTAIRSQDLLKAVEGLNGDEQAVVFGVAMRVAARMHLGRTYGPLDLSATSKETRDFAQEAYEEALDGAAYGEMRVIRAAYLAARGPLVRPLPPPRSAKKKRRRA